MPDQLVSIVIAFHSYPDVLPVAVESALGQTYSNVEVVVVDDCSTKGDAREICSKFNNAKLRVIRHEKNGGLAKARNTGVTNAKGDLIVPLDDDDYIDKTYVEKTLKALTDDVVGVCSDVQIFGDLNMVWNIRPELLSVMCAMSSPSTFLYRKQAYDAVGGYVERPDASNTSADPLTQLHRQLTRRPDSEFWLRLLKKGFKIGKVDEPLYFYWKHDASLSSEDKACEVPVMAGLHPDLYGQHMPDVLRIEEEKYWQAKSEYESLSASYDNLAHYYAELKEDYAKLAAVHHELTCSRSWGVAQKLMQTSASLKRLIGFNGATKNGVTTPAK